MNKILLFAIMIFPVHLMAQESDAARPNRLHGGFYFKAGPVFPVGSYSTGQTISFININPPKTTLTYLPARIGAALDLGFLIYLGPSFANKFLRAGIDATFLSVWFNSTKPPSTDNKIEKYYSFIGQKFGPVISVNPVSRLVLDFSYKLNANFSYHDELDGWALLSDSQTSEYGIYLLGNEVSLAVRYSIMVFTFEYNFGPMNYNNINNDNKDQKINIDTFRVLLGLKF